MTNRFGILLYRWHSWVGLFSGIFLIVICTTGSVAVFRPELERAVDWDGFNFTLSKPAPAQQPITVEQAIATAEASAPGSKATAVRFPAKGSSTQIHGQTYHVTITRPKTRPAQVLVDPYANSVVSTISSKNDWGDFVRQLHVRFFYGSFWGRYLVGMFGILLLFSTVSGSILFPRFNAKSWKPKLRCGRGARIFQADLHKIVGLGSVAFNIIFGVSGAVIGLEGIYHKYYAQKAKPPRFAAVQQLKPGELQTCIDQAAALIPTAEPVSVGLNNLRNGIVKVDMVHWDTKLIREQSSYVIFNAKTLSPVETYDASKASSGVRFYYAMEPLHFGRLGGSIIVKLIWAFMGLTAGFLSISGFVIFIIRQRKARQAKRAVNRGPVSPVPARPGLVAVSCVAMLLALPSSARAEATTASTVIRSAGNGNWSAAATWEGNRVPTAGDRVQIRPGHAVTYDVQSDAALRVLHVAGRLTFSRDRDTQLTAGLIVVQPGEELAGEAVADCHTHTATRPTRVGEATLDIGSADAPLATEHHATIRLQALPGMDPDLCPGLIVCGGRIDLHGGPMNRTWVKLGLQADAGDNVVFLDEPVTGWRVGDRILLTATSRQLLYTNTFTKKVSDCVGYRSLGHGIYLEDGTESFNILDRNLIVQALRTDPLPLQFLPFDRNDGAAFWWANSRNAFTRNVAVECDQYGYRFEVVKSSEFDPALPVPQPDGSRESTDLRTIPFIRFEGNEAHSQRRFGLNLGGIPSHRGYGNNEAGYKIQTDDVNGVGPDREHPFVLTRSLLWDCQWPFHAGSPMAVIDGMDIFDSEYGIWRSVMLHHQYRDLTFDRVRSHTIFFPRTGGANQFEADEEPPPTLKDTFAPITVITQVTRHTQGALMVRGTSTDNGEIAAVTVNGISASAIEPNFLTWEATLDNASAKISAAAVDAAGNTEVRPHEVVVPQSAVAQSQ